MKFLSLYATNLWGVMNDNVLKILVCFVAASWVAPEYASVVVNATAGILVLPYVFLSPLAGRLPGLFGKIRVVRVAKFSEIPIMAVAISGFLLHSVWVVLAAVLLMGLQSCLFSPSKYSLIKDIGGVGAVSQGMGGMEAVSFIGMLSGSVLASFLVDHADAPVWFAVLIGLAILGVCSSLSIKATETPECVESSARSFTFLRQTHAMLKKYRGINWVIHFLSVFWWLSASLQTIMIIHCDKALGLSPWQTGCLLALMAIGISAGCLVAGRIDKRTGLIAFSPLMGFVLMLLLCLTFVFCHNVPVFATLIFLVALVGGMFKIPLDAEIQKRVDQKELSVTLAFFNQVSFIYIFAASASNILILAFLPSQFVFLFAGLVVGAASLVFIFSYRKAVCQVGHIFLRCHYDISTIGRDALNVKPGDNLLILPAHRAVLDPLLLFAELHDVRAQPLSDDGYFKIPVIGHVLSLFDAIEVPDLRRSRKGAEKVMGLKDVVANSLRSGANVLFYPSGHITLDGGESIGTRQLAYEACRNMPPQTHVIAVHINGLWGSEWSRYGRSATPSLAKLLLKASLLIFSGAIFFMPRRKISIEYVDITESARLWATASRADFNKSLEAFYAQNWIDGVEAVS